MTQATVWNKEATRELPFMEKICHEYDGRPIIQYDAVPKIEKLLARGYFINNDGKVVAHKVGKAHDTPWIYTRPQPQFNCSLWHDVMFNVFGIFPPECKKCWKVVVRPRTVKELVALYDLQEYHTELYCKAGIEVRPYVPASYGGYFYTTSQEEGTEALKQVKELVSKMISPDIPIVLKRYCSEYELAFGPSAQLEETLMRGYFIHPEEGRKNVMTQGDMAVWHSIATQIVELKFEVVAQPKFLKQHVIRTWFDFAWERGDMSVKEFFGGKPLYTPACTYNPEEDK